MQAVLVKPQIKIIQPKGYLNTSNTPEFKSKLTAAVLAPESGCLVVNLGQVEFLDSADLMALISAFNLSKRLNRRFVLCSVSPPIRMIFELTKLDRAFEFFENRDSFESTTSEGTL